MIFFLMFLTFSLWIGGYMMTARFMSTTGTHGEDLEKLITPPKWLFYLCGAPVSKRYPMGIMRVVAFRTQIMGCFLGLFIVLYLIFRPSASINIVVFGVCVLSPYLIAAYVSKHHALKNQVGIRWRNISKNQTGPRGRRK